MTRFVQLTDNASEQEAEILQNQAQDDGCYTHWENEKNETEERCPARRQLYASWRKKMVILVSLFVMVLLIISTVIILTGFVGSVATDSEIDVSVGHALPSQGSVSFKACVGYNCSSKANLEPNSSIAIPAAILKNICQTRECIQLSSLFLEAVNTSRNPCIDFNAFACGWSPESRRGCGSDTFFGRFGLCREETKLAFKGIMEERVRHNLLPRATQNAITAYKSCTNPDSNGTFPWEYFHSFVHEIGGWPMMDSKWNTKRYRWKTGLASAIRLAGLAPIIGFEIVPNPSSPGQASILLSKPKNNPHVSIEKIRWVLDALANMSTVDAMVFAQDKDDVIQLHSFIRDLASNQSVENNEAKNTSIGILHAEIKTVEWLNLIHLVTNDALSETSFTITSDDFVLVKDVWYLDSIGKHIVNGNSMKRVIANYIATVMLLQTLRVVPNTTKPFVVDSSLIGDGKEHWELCLEEVYRALKMAVDWRYMEKEGLPVPLVRNITLQLLDSFRESLRHTSIETHDQRVLSDQIRTLQREVKDRQWLPDEYQLEKYYEMLEDMGQDPVNNYWKLQKFRMLKVISQIHTKSPDYWLPGSPWPKTVWPADLDTLISASPLLRTPKIYHPNLPTYINFGALGSVIAEKLVTSSVEVLRNGNSRDMINSRYSCIKNRLAKEVEEVSPHVPVDWLVHEATVLQVAYQAFQTRMKNRSIEEKFPGFERYSSDQLFFLSYGITHCPEWKSGSVVEMGPRPNGSHLKLRFVMDTKHFLNAFRCSQNQTAVNEEACATFW